MLCTTCRRALLQRLHNHKSPSSRNLLNHQTTRSVATVPLTKNAAPAIPPPSTTSPNASFPTTSSSKPGQTQPFSEPFFPSSTSSTSTAPSSSSPRPNASAPRKLTSSVAGGTPLTGLMYTKNAAGKPLLALEDDQYPAWLWMLLDGPSGQGAENSGAGANADGVDLASMTKKVRAKYERKQAKLLAGMEKPVPLHEQSRDLTGPGDDARVSVERREELTRSMRGARRKGIREANFLRSM